MSGDSSNLPPVSDRRGFATTQWSVVLAAAEGSGPESTSALADLCSAYWYPLYAYVRRRVPNVDDAQELTQDFFAHLLEKQTIGRADPDRGRFRAFLITSLKNFLANHWQKQRAARRGGSATRLTLDFESGESRYRLEPVDELTPECLYERRWILTLLDLVLDHLHREWTEAGKAKQFELLKKTLTDEATMPQYEEAGAALGVSAAAAKQAAYRLRRRYRQLFRLEVARTLANEAELNDEMGRLLQVLSG